MTKLLTGILFLMTIIGAKAQVPTEHSLLWEITPPKGSTVKPSYLFGTMHLMCPMDFSIPEKLKTALTKSQQVALELDMDDPNMMATTMQLLNMKDGKTIKDLLSTAEYNRIETYYKDSIGISITMMEKMKPFILMSTLYGKILSCSPQSYEMKLVEMATQLKTEVVGLETPQEQMAIFDTIPYQDQMKMVLYMVDSIPQVRKEFKELVDLYKAGDIQEMYDLSLKTSYGVESYSEVMLFDRNERWIARIGKMLKEKPTLFAVGAAHLGGEKGVINLLRKAGYTVNPIMN